jgi:hypothetical protein
MTRRPWRQRTKRDEDEIVAVALDALDAHELEQAEADIRASRSGSRSLDSYRDAASLLARSTEVSPPEDLKAKVLAAAFEARPPSTAPVPDEPDELPNVVEMRPRRAERRTVVLGGAVLAAAAAVGGLLVWQATSTGEPATASATLSGEAPGTIELSWTDDEISLDATGMPAVAGDEVYQLWLLTDDGPVSAGVFRPGDSGAAEAEFDLEVGDPSGFGVTVEPGPDGSPQPTSDIVMSGEPEPT